MPATTDARSINLRECIRVNECPDGRDCEDSRSHSYPDSHSQSYAHSHSRILTINALANTAGIAWHAALAVVMRAGIVPEQRARGLVIPAGQAARAVEACREYAGQLRAMYGG